MANDKNITLGQLVDTLEVVDEKFIDEDELREAQESYDTTSLAYGTCTTAAATAAKVVTVSGDANWKLAAGSVIFVKFSYTNTASNPTLNVNGTGAKSVVYNTAVITTSNLTYAGYADRTAMYVYNGTQFVFQGWSIDSNTTYSNASLGQGYGTCSTAAATTAKVVTLSSYSLTKGGVVSVKFSNAVPAGATMNINSKGAKAIYYRGAAITAGIIEAGDVATFIYDGSQYHLLTVDRHRFFSLLVPYGTAIEEDADLDTVEYLKVGNYFCSSNAKAKTLINSPTTTAFMMTVSSPLSTTVDNESTGTWVYRLRKIQLYTGPEYIQYCYANATADSTNGTAGTWTYGPWMKVMKSTDINKSASISLAAASWASGSGISDYPYKYTLSVSGVTADSVVELKVDPASMSAASDCGMCPTCDSGSGTVTFYSATAPTSAITGTLHFT